MARAIVHRITTLFSPENKFNLNGFEEMILAPKILLPNRQQPSHIKQQQPSKRVNIRFRRIKKDPEGFLRWLCLSLRPLVVIEGK